ncbi:MAG: hypothetical protein E6Q95_00800 [Chitinophagaceae bacterium]|nr:MAG: hypothetical protein E6Q95_00800 [Chitinophagaceae bacterium]
MTQKLKLLLATSCIFLLSCTVTTNNYNTSIESKKLDIIGTWHLISGTTITKKDTVFTDYTKNLYGIKIFNRTHFSFFNHDTKKGKDSTAAFTAGAGTYSLVGNNYTEHLDFLNYRDWEGRSFHFKISIQNDTLTQYGEEKLEDLGVNRLIIEKYVRLK